MHDSQDLIASAEVCSQLGVNRSTLTRWVRDQLITPALKMPGKRGGYLFTPSEVDRFIQERFQVGDGTLKECNKGHTWVLDWPFCPRCNMTLEAISFFADRERKLRNLAEVA